MWPEFRNGRIVSSQRFASRIPYLVAYCLVGPFGLVVAPMTDLVETDHPSFQLPTNKDIPIWRYMDLAKYLWMLERKCLFFTRATLLGDPFEGSSTKMEAAVREYIRANRATDPDLAGYKDFSDEMLTKLFEQWSDLPKSMLSKHLISCWHMSEYESAAMWKIYSSANESVCIRSTYRRLRQCLPQCVFIGQVKYIDYDTEQIPGRAAFQNIMHKRLPFEYERELRAIFWELIGYPEAQGYKPQIEANGLAMQVDLSALIERVFVSPAAAPWFAQLVEAMTKRYGFTFPLTHSSLAGTPVY